MNRNKREQIIRDLCWVIGVIEGVRAPMGNNVGMLLDECYDKLSMTRALLIRERDTKDVHTDDDKEADASIPQDAYNQ